jgi:para-aminobenzoate synthetase component I
VITKTFDLTSDPFDLFSLFREETGLFFLDSSLASTANGRYSFIGFDPFLVREGRTLEAFHDFRQEFRALAGLMGPAAKHMAPLTAGAVGYLSYDLGLLFQGIRSAKPDEQAPLFHFGFYDVILTVDHQDKKLYVTSSGLPEGNVSRRLTRAQERLGQVCDLLSRREREGIPETDGPRTPLDFKSDSPKEDYIKAVRRALEHIRQGDIYEINLAHKITTARSGVSAPQIYQRLREFSPSHFSAFYNAGSRQLLCSSPERFLSFKDGIAQIRPMKGTRPRGLDPDEDARLKSELLKSEKEIAELLMVTDLERNDLGRVCEFGSVKVREMREIEEYKTVFQATSTVEGALRRECDGFDLIEACFPGGSVTGCPKIRAMQIIDELEVGRRGIYTGAFGYLDFSGHLDFNILIRTLVIERDRVSFHVGGGIVADSDPVMEYDETWIKARALMASLQESSRPSFPRS